MGLGTFLQFDRADKSAVTLAAAEAYTNAYAIPLTQKGAASGVATLDISGRLPTSQLSLGVFDYVSGWAASTNTPTLANGTGISGQVYIASDAGTVDFGAGPIVFASGDFAIYNGSIWERIKGSAPVTTVFGRAGAVTAQSGDYTAAQVGADASGAAAAAQAAAQSFATTADATVLSTAEAYADGIRNARVTTVADAVSIATNADTTDIIVQVNTQAGGTLTISNPTGSPTDGQRLLYRVKCTNSQTLALGNAFRGSTDTALPTTTSAGKTDYFGFRWNATDSKWDFLASNQGF